MFVIRFILCVVCQLVYHNYDQQLSLEPYCVLGLGFRARNGWPNGHLCFDITAMTGSSSLHSHTHLWTLESVILYSVFSFIKSSCPFALSLICCSKFVYTFTGSAQYAHTFVDTWHILTQVGGSGSLVINTLWHLLSIKQLL